MRRQFFVAQLSRVTDDAEQAVLQLREPRLAALVDAIHAFVAEQQADVLQLDHIDVARGLRRDALQDLEKLFAAGFFLVKHDQQRLPRPVALRTPGSVEHRGIEKRAQ